MTTRIRTLGWLATGMAGSLLLGCAKEDTPAPTPEPIAAECAPQAIAEPVTREISAGLTAKTTTQGCGAAIVNGQTAVVHYTGWLFDAEAADQRGAEFDSSHSRNQHFPFPLGARKVIAGWDQGVLGMQVGEVRELTIAPELAYGQRDLGIIPSGSTLVFEVELARIEGAPPEAATPASQ